MWPAPSKHSKRLPGIASWAARPCATGMIESFSPHTISDGIRSASASRLTALTRWPPGSTTARSVCRKAWREPALSSSAKPRASTATSPAGRRPTRPSRPPSAAAEPDEALRRERGQDVVGDRQRRGAQQHVDVAAEPAAGDEHEPLGALGELVGELHRDAAAERVPDDRHAVVAERGDDVARAAGVGAERVVAARRRGLAVAEQVGRDHRVLLGSAAAPPAPTCRTSWRSRGAAAARARCRRSGSSRAGRGARAPGARRSSQTTGEHAAAARSADRGRLPRQMEGAGGADRGARPSCGLKRGVIPVTQEGVTSTVPFKRLAIVNRGEAAMRAINAVRELNEERDEPITRDRALHRARAPRPVRPPVRRAPLPRPRDDRGRGRQVDLAPTSTTSGSSARSSRRAPTPPGSAGASSPSTPRSPSCARSSGSPSSGPSAEVMRALGDKIEGKRLAEKAGVPVAPWSGGPVETAEEARKVGEELGFPLMIKAAAGGGGRGMRRVEKAEELENAFERARAEAASGVRRPERADGAPRRRRAPRRGAADGRRPGRRVGARRARLLLPAPPPEGRRGVRQPGAHARAGDASSPSRRCGSRSRPATTAPAPSSSSTSPTAASFSFMEVNTRLQVEHPVTEVVTGTDLVRLQLHVAAGGRLEGDPPPPRGHAIEVRLNAEDPGRGFAPSPGRITPAAPARRAGHPRRHRRRRGRHACRPSSTR